MVDKFTKYALLGMVLIVAIMTISAYIGFIVGGNAATDDKVNNMAGGGSTYSPFTVEPFGETGEYVGFCTAASVGGFIVGYLFPSVLSNNVVSRSEN
jgi:ABC-type thiamin/hydroxymethylpyrimidine transport system permease subunit